MQQVKCNHCPRVIDEKTFPVFQCDHIDRSTKIADISDMVLIKKYKKSHIREELKKCQLLCACCHRRKTAMELKWPTLEEYKLYPIDVKVKAYKIFLDASINGKPPGYYAHHSNLKEFMGDAWIRIEKDEFKS